MTVTDTTPNDTINYKKDEIKYAICNNTALESMLNVVAVISNPCLYASRYRLFREFFDRLSSNENVVVYVVELVLVGPARFNNLVLTCPT